MNAALTGHRQRWTLSGHPGWWEDHDGTPSCRVRCGPALGARARDGGRS